MHGKLDSSLAAYTTMAQRPNLASTGPPQVSLKVTDSETETALHANYIPFPYSFMSFLDREWLMNFEADYYY